VSERVGLAVNRGVKAYDHGPQHPLQPARVQLTWDLIEAYGLTDRPNVSVIGFGEAPEETLELVHERGYIEATKRAGHGEDGDWWRFGYGPGDNPVFDRMHEAAALVVGGTIAAARAVIDGELEHAFNAAGGLHHAMPARASGFCVYDDPAVAIAWMLGRGVDKVAYVDVDVHHGDGVQAIFYDDPRVLTVSIHEYAPEFGFFPGTGDPSERGGPNAQGTCLNVPMPPLAGDDQWMSAFRVSVPQAVAEFEPDVIVTQLGCDTHASDPIAHLRLTTGCYREVAAELHRLAHEVCDGRWIATGGGGYQWARVVPRAWTIYFAEMAGAEPSDKLPPAWIELAEGLLEAPMPTTLSEPRVPDSGLA
jgi:acetoin utilization protein AcuC